MHFLILLVVILLCGCISYDESLLFCGVPDYKYSGIEELKQDVNSVLIHKDSQQYCASSISLAKFITLQLSEGLATYLVNLIDIGLKICPEEIIKCSIHSLCDYLYRAHSQGSLAFITLQICNVDVQLRPNDWESYYRIGSLYLNLHDMKSSETFLLKSYSLNPSSHAVLFLLGNLYTTQQLQPGEYYYYKSLLVTENITTSELSLVYTNTGHFNIYANHHIRAKECYQEALYHEKNEQSEFFLCDRKRSTGSFKDWTQLCHDVKRIVKDAKEDSTLSPYFLLFYPMPADGLKKIAKAISSKGLPRIEPYPMNYDFFTYVINPNNRIVKQLSIGYYTRDFSGTHPMCLLTTGMIQNHNLNFINDVIYNYNKNPEDSNCFRKIKDNSFEYKDISNLTNDDIIRTIRNDNIEILIELMGHTQANRNDALAVAAAPIQVTYLGYPGTTGSPYTQYNMVDKYILPPEHADEVTEKIVYVPFTYQVNNHFTRTSFCGTSIKCKNYLRKLNGLPTDKFIFTSFNTQHKIDADAFRLWITILRRVPNSILWLLDAENESHRKNLLNEFISGGVSSNRIYFANHIDRNKHLMRIAAADLFLDNFRYGAHTTASDALWCGVPVLTREGELFASRVGSSFLRNLDLSMLLVYNEKDYYNKAIEIGLNSKLYIKIRNELSKVILRGSVNDKWLNSRGNEVSYYLMWEVYSLLKPCFNIIVNNEYSLLKDSPNLKRKMISKLNYSDLIMNESPILSENILVRLLYSSYKDDRMKKKIYERLSNLKSLQSNN